jgi:hypothetical protein
VKPSAYAWENWTDKGTATVSAVGSAPTHPTAEQIAKEAAEDGYEAVSKIGTTYPEEIDALASIILTAGRRIAAQERERLLQMVRDSGAVEALERAGCWVPSNAVDTKKALTHPVHECRTLAQVDAALAKLKAITQP